MGAIPTKEIFKRYYDGKPDLKEWQKHTLNRPELYEYEKEIGKELIDMNADDLLGLFSYFRCKNGTSVSSYSNIVAELRKIFNFYIDEIEIIRNPAYSDKLIGNSCVKSISKDNHVIQKNDVYNIINQLHRDLDEDYADYVELIILLFYNGFSKSEEIISFKEDAVNHYLKTVKYNDKKIKLSDRCYELLIKFNNLESIPAYRGKYLLLSWRGSFLKFIVRPSTEERFNDKELFYVRDKINRYLATEVGKRYETKVNYMDLYFLGFYEFLTNNCGKDVADKIINSTYDKEDTEILMQLANEYGVSVLNPGRLRRYLIPYTVCH